jgi:WD40 repeat protein
LIASVGLDGAGKLWDTDTGEVKYTLKGQTSAFECVAFRPDGKQIAAGGYERPSLIRLWSLPQAKKGK